MHDKDQLLVLTAEIVVAAVTGGNVRPGDLPEVIADTYKALEATAGDASAVSIEETVEYVPAVTAQKSLASDDHIVSMIDGKPYKTLRRHLATNGLTPEEYRARYDLKADYPMVAKNYSESRRALAKASGLGRKLAASE